MRWNGRWVSGKTLIGELEWNSWLGIVPNNVLGSAGGFSIDVLGHVTTSSAASGVDFAFNGWSLEIFWGDRCGIWGCATNVTCVFLSVFCCYLWGGEYLVRENLRAQELVS